MAKLAATSKPIQGDADDPSDHRHLVRPEPRPLAADAAGRRSVGAGGRGGIGRGRHRPPTARRVGRRRPDPVGGPGSSDRGSGSVVDICAGYPIVRGPHRGIAGRRGEQRDAGAEDRGGRQRGDRQDDQCRRVAGQQPAESDRGEAQHSQRAQGDAKGGDARAAARAGRATGLGATARGRSARRNADTSASVRKASTIIHSGRSSHQVSEPASGWARPTPGRRPGSARWPRTWP